MVVEVVPVWKRHIEASRRAVEDGVGSLLDSFSRLCDGVSTVARTVAPDAAAQPAISLNAQQEAALARSLSAVDRTHEQRERLLVQLATGLLQLESVEAQLRPLAAANAPVAQQLGQLRDTSEQMADLARQVAQDTRADHARQDTALMDARALVQTLATEQLRSSAATRELHALSARVERDLERVLVGLQFQDRLSQALDGLGADMQRFTDWMASHEPAGPAEAARWRAELERSHLFSEPPQAAPPAGAEAGAANNGSPTTTSAVEFF